MRSGGAAEERRTARHLCCVYDDAATFHACALAFLADGLARGNRVRFVGSGDVSAMREQLERLPHRGPNAVETSSVEQSYGARTAPVDGPATVATYAAVGRQALADGFTGLRVAADVTAFVRTPAQLDAFARYEHLADRLMVGTAISGLCGLNRAEVGEAAVAQLACLHPEGDTDTPFRVHAAPDADVAVSGELDLATADLFPQALERTGLLAKGPDEVVVDVTGLRFIDHRNLIALVDLAHRRRRTVVLRTSREAPARLVAALGLGAVRVEHALRPGA
jgi:anti-anti-sigma regulatory factor